ncbi:hypothetical protein FS837_008038 [Tulasnella sp. UAMH 9824]|nr:hypothetical protein FS837_008038 [Tulasnella sp. UAMH 9824]
MRPQTSGRARTSRSQGTRRRQSSAALTSSVPPTLESSTPSSTYESQSSTGSLPTPSQIAQAEAPNLTQQESYVPTEEESDEESVDPGPSSQPPGHTSRLKFPYQLYRMINDEQMGQYIRWDGLDVFQVLGVDPFEKKALPKYFPRQKTGSSQPKFAHWNRKFCQGREDLLDEVVRRPKQHPASTPQVMVQAHTPIPSTPSFSSSVSQPSGQGNLNTRVSLLEYRLSQLTAACAQQSAQESRLLAKEKRLLAKEKRLLSREKRLLTRETRLFAREKRLAAKERQLESREKGVLARERQLERELQLQEMASEQPAISTEPGSPYPIDQTGLAGAAVDQDSDMCDGGEFHDAHDEITWNSGIDTTDGSNVWEPLSYLETETTSHIPDSSPFVGRPPHPHPPGFPATDLILPSTSDLIPSSHSDFTFSSSYANEHQDSKEHHPGSPALDERIAAWHYSHFNPFSGSWWQNSSAPEPTSPSPISAQAASGPGSRIPVAQVPSLSRPGSSRCW